MTALTLQIVARTLFDTDVTPRIREVARLGTEIEDFYYGRFASLRFLIPTWLPTPETAGLHKRSGASTKSCTRSSGSGARARTGATCSRCCCSRDERGTGLFEGRSAMRS